MARVSTGSVLPVLYDPISNNSVSLVWATRLAYAQQVTYMANVFHDVICDVIVMRQMNTIVDCLLSLSVGVEGSITMNQRSALYKGTCTLG